MIELSGKFESQLEPDAVRDRLSPEDYKHAIFAQDGCNVSGLAHSFSAVMPKIWAEARATGNESTEWVNRHPIVLLYLNKMCSLADAENWDAYSKAYEACLNLSRRDKSSKP